LKGQTYHTAEAAHMPLRPQSLDNRIRNRLATLSTLCTKAIRMAPDTPRISLFFDKRRGRVKWITTLRAEEVADMPLGAARDDDLALDGRLAALAAGREELMEVEVAVEAHAFVDAVLGFETLHVFVRGMGWEELDVFAALAGMDAGDALEALVVGLGVEGYAF
jgi:hypothetical protein